MTTIVNNPPSSDKSGGVLGLIVGIVILVVLLYMGYVYGLPAMQRMQSGSIQINVPESVDVNVKQE